MNLLNQQTLRPFPAFFASFRLSKEEHFFLIICYFIYQLKKKKKSHRVHVEPQCLRVQRKTQETPPPPPPETKWPKALCPTCQSAEQKGERGQQNATMGPHTKLLLLGKKPTHMALSIGSGDLAGGIRKIRHKPMMLASQPQELPHPLLGLGSWAGNNCCSLINLWMHLPIAQTEAQILRYVLPPV